MSLKSNKKASFKKGKIQTQRIVITVLVVITNILVVYALGNSSKFASFGRNKFIMVNIMSLVLLLGMNFSIMISMRKLNKTLDMIGKILLCAMLLIGSYGTYATVRVNRSLNKMTSKKSVEAVGVALIAYSENGNAKLEGESSLANKKVGYALGTKQAEFGKEQLNSNSINVDYVEYQDYSAEIMALFEGSIDCAILPKNYMSMFGNEMGLKEYLDDTYTVSEFEKKVTIENTEGSDKDLTKEPFTVLLIGNADGLSDTMILCSVNPISMTVTMSSIARDSYVPISCYGGNSNKLNAAHGVSRDCLIDTIENLVGVDIDYYVDTNFQGVVDVVDAVGGITVDSPVEFVGQDSSSSRGKYTVWVPAGKNVHLNGQQALCFARERHLFATGDFARQVHQQEVIEATLREIMRTNNVETLFNVLDAAGDNIQTNFTVEQMSGFMSYAMQKSKRYLDPDHAERVFTIVGSRITGYGSGLWNEAMQLTLYIYRLWDGSIADTREAIERNIDLDTKITPMPQMQWSANWDFTPPTISHEVYNEVVVKSEAPTTIGNYVGKKIGSLQSWAQSFGKEVWVEWVNDSSQENDTVLSQDVAPGTSIDDITAINVRVVRNDGIVEPEPTSKPTEEPTNDTVTINSSDYIGYDYSSFEQSMISKAIIARKIEVFSSTVAKGNVISLDASGEIAKGSTVVATVSKGPEPTEKPTPTPTNKPTPKPTPVPTTKPTPVPTQKPTPVHKDEEQSEPIPFDTEIREKNDLPVGTENEVQQGVNGERKRTYSYDLYPDGSKQNEKYGEWKIVTEPTKRIIERGTKQPDPEPKPEPDPEPKPEPEPELEPGPVVDGGEDKEVPAGDQADGGAVVDEVQADS